MSDQQETPADEYLEGLHLHLAADVTGAVPVRLVCGCCGYAAEFASYRAAWEAGWDTPDRFGYTGCDLCPGAAVFFPLYYSGLARNETDLDACLGLLAKAAKASHMHDEIHEAWEQNGRPTGPLAETASPGDEAEQ